MWHFFKAPQRAASGDVDKKTFLKPTSPLDELENAVFVSKCCLHVLFIIFNKCIAVTSATTRGAILIVVG